MQPDEINALPERVRRYIHDLHARVDPAGEVAALWAARESAAALAARVVELEARVAELEAAAARNLPEHMAEKLSSDGRTRQLDLWYPRVEGNPAFVEVGLMDVRATDSIRISYDFGRDGWKVEQASTFEWDANDKVCDPDWKEVAFVEAWGRETSPEGTPLTPGEIK